MDERSIGAVAPLVQGAGGDAFAGAGFAEEEDGEVGEGDVLQAAAEVLDGRALANGGIGHGRLLVLGEAGGCEVVQFYTVQDGRAVLAYANG